MRAKHSDMKGIIMLEIKGMRVRLVGIQDSKLTSVELCPQVRAGSMPYQVGGPRVTETVQMGKSDL